jgi:hypothetical protein
MLSYTYETWIFLSVALHVLYLCFVETVSTRVPLKEFNLSRMHEAIGFSFIHVVPKPMEVKTPMVHKGKVLPVLN